MKFINFKIVWYNRVYIYVSSVTAIDTLDCH